MNVIDTGSNPLIIISPDEVMAWLRQKADEAGYADRESCAVQAAFRNTSDGEPVFQWHPPELTIMVSNIKGGRAADGAGVASNRDCGGKVEDGSKR